MKNNITNIVFRKTKLVLKNIDNHRSGELIILVFMEPGFPKKHEKAINKYRVKPKTPDISLFIDVPEKQEFALVVLHDEDLNGKVTKNWTGYLPSEGLGFSSGVTILSGLPKFKKSKIKFTENKTIAVTMRYPRWFGI